MKKFRFVSIGMIMFMAFVITGCGSGDAAQGSVQSDEPLTIGMSFQDMDNPYFVVMREALEEAGASMGAEIITTDAAHDVLKQINDIEDMVQRGIDILLINPTDSVGVRSAVESTKEAGVVIVAVDAQAEGPIDSFVGSRNYDAGLKAGEFMGQYLDGEGTVAILDGIPVVPILERVRGFRDGLAAYPGIEIVDVQNGRQERDHALSVTENMIQAHPNLDGIFSVNDGGALGSLAAIESSGREIALVSVDGHPEAVEAVLGNTPFKATVAQYPRDQVRIGIGIALAKYWGANIPSEVPIEVTLLTPENAGGFSW